MKDNNLLGFIVIDILLAVGVIWGLMMGYKLLGYGLLVYLVLVLFVTIRFFDKKELEF